MRIIVSVKGQYLKDRHSLDAGNRRIKKMLKRRKSDKGYIRIFTWFESNSYSKPHWYINLMVRTFPNDKKKEKLTLFDIAKFAGSSLYTVDSNIISISFDRYKTVNKLKFLCELQRYAQDRELRVEFEPLQF